MHHPFVAAILAWWAVCALVLRLDQGSLVLALLTVASPSIAVYLAHRLARRAQRQIQEKLDEQTEKAESVAAAARRAVSDAEDAAATAKVTADETHQLVNSQKDKLEEELALRDSRIAILEARLEGPAG